MKKHATIRHGLVAAALLALPLAATAQVPVDDNGNVVGAYESAPDAAISGRATGNEDIPLLTTAELEELVGPVALYPDELLAIVLPAAAYPMQLIEAQRFLEALEDDPSLEPNPEWDDAVVALLNYPEVVALLNEDIDWTWRLGEAVVAQQAEVVAAVESFRDRAYAAGNLKSDGYQNVSRNDGAIEITPVSDDVIYVPYYEPERVVVYQPRPVYYYYPRAYPVYYYPYPSSYVFNNGFFWGVTTAFTIGWVSDSLHVYHSSYYGHPYYGWTYWDSWWYRRPTISVYNTTYVRNSRITVNHYYNGDRWHPSHERRRPVRPSEPRVMNRHYYQRDPEIRNQRTRSVSTRDRRTETREPIRFRDRSDERARVINRNDARPGTDTVARQLRESRERGTTRRPGPTTRSTTRPTSDSIARQLRENRERNTTQRRDTVTRPRDRQQPVARTDRSAGNERTVRSRNNNPTVARQRTDRRDVSTLRNPERNSGASRRVERSAPVTRTQSATPRVQPRNTARVQPRSTARVQPQQRATSSTRVQSQPRQAPRREASRSSGSNSSSRQAPQAPRKRSKDRRATR